MLKKFIKYVSQNMLGMVGMSVYILADTYFISVAVGADGITALNLVLPIYNIIFAIGAMMGVGSAIRFVVERNKKSPDADGYFFHALVWAFIISLFFIFVGLFLPDKLIALLGGDAQIVATGKNYTRIFMCFAPFFMWNYICNAFVRNDGNPSIAMSATLFSSLFNIVFDYIFIFPCGLGMFGAALATGFSPFVSILVLLTHLRRPSRGFHLVKTPLRVSRVPSLCAPGLSSLIGEIASGVVLLLFNLVLLRLSGNTGVAAYGVVANLALVGIAVFTGLCTGIQPLVSRSSGLGDREQLRRLFRWGICTALGIAAVLCVSVFLGAEPLTAVFNSEHDPQLAAYAESGLRIYFTGFLFAGVNMVTAAFFSASDKTVQGFVLSLLRGVIAVPPILFPLAWALGVDGVWLTFPMVELVTAVAALVWARKYIIEN